MKVGIIAEDSSDVETLMVLIRRIIKKNIAHGRKYGGGCGTIIRKCLAWAENLKTEGCGALILISDADSLVNSKIRLKHLDFQSALRGTPIQKNIIVVPVEELEAWLLSDTEAIKKAMGLKASFRIKAPPECIPSPKEYLEDLVSKYSSGKKSYINTVHNQKIAEHTSITEILKKCSTFAPLHKFILEHLT